MAFPSLSRFARNRPRLAARLGVALYLIVTLTYLVMGQANADEGWYLYASRLVLRGAIPYQDFAYTQMPLLPYIYGPVQILHQSILFGRLTSIGISIGTLLMCMVIARRFGGTRASAIAALLFGSLTFCVYYLTIVKTYALVAFFFAATLFLLSSKLDDNRKYLLALTYALLAALVRITAVFFVVPVLVYVLSTAPKKVRVLALVETAAASLLVATFLSADWPAARWSLFSSHLSHWGSSPLIDRIKDVLTLRLPEVAQSFGPALVLGLAALYFMIRLRDANSWGRDLAPLFVTTAGAVLFGASHLANGIWGTEYLVPAAIALVPITAIALSRLYLEMSIGVRPFVFGLLIAVVLLLPIGESTQHTDLTGGRLPLSEINQAADFVDRNSRSDEKVMALEALDVAVDADRSVLPGMTLAQFSLQNVDLQTSQELHVVNAGVLVQAITRQVARTVILTDTDLDNLAAAATVNSEEVPGVLEQHYYEGCVMAQFGESSRTLHVYLSRSGDLGGSSTICH